jgi:hypothetical protein
MRAPTTSLRYTPTVAEGIPGLMDPLLVPLIHLRPDEAGQSLERLVTTHAIPVIDSVVRKCQGWADMAAIRDDVRGEVAIRLLRRLRTLSEQQDPEPIVSFRNYVATITFHAVDDLLRRHYPQRNQLKNRLRYLLGHDDRFATGTDANGATLCSLATTVARVARSRSTNIETLAGQAILILQRRSPIELNDFVTALAEVTGVRDETAGDHNGSMDRFAVTISDPLTRMETMDDLRMLWAEIELLPVRQRLALLLNLRDPAGESVVNLLPLLGISSIRQIASTLGLGDDALLAVWDRLPLPDAEIARMLSLTRQQVINLRKSARERLHRSMARSDRWQR